MLKTTIKKTLLFLKTLSWNKGNNNFEKDILVSIIIPTYNRKEEISHAITSILNQKHTNFEILIIDDGSTDNTIESLNSLFSNEIEEKKIKIFSQFHKGVSDARNIGLQNAKGEFITYLDSDNTWGTKFLGTMLYKLSKSKYTSAYCAVSVKNHQHNIYKILFNPTFNWGLLLKENYIDLNSFIHHRSLYEKYGGFDTNLTRLVDWDLILRYTKNSPALPVKSLLVNYCIDKKTRKYSITTHENFEENEKKIRQKWK